MPYFILKTNVPQSRIPADLSKKLTEVLSKSLGKPLAYCVASVTGDVNLSWGASSEPAALATLMSIGALGIKENKEHSKALFDIVNKELSIPPDRMYIQFINAPSSDVGFNGTTFHELFGA